MAADKVCSCGQGETALKMVSFFDYILTDLYRGTIDAKFFCKQSVYDMKTNPR